MWGKPGQKRLPGPGEALPGRREKTVLMGRHAVLGTGILPPYPPGLQIAEFALGCFWGAERRFWSLPGVFATAVGYAGGLTPNPTYEEVCTGFTAHAESVRVVFDPARLAYGELLREFWEAHDPTQGWRQGNDVGSQYRSVIFVASREQRNQAESSLGAYQQTLNRAGWGQITTEIAAAGEFYFAEEYHQQYLSEVKNPNGYCGLGGTGVACPVGLTSTA